MVGKSDASALSGGKTRNPSITSARVLADTQICGSVRTKKRVIWVFVSEAAVEVVCYQVGKLHTAR